MERTSAGSPPADPGSAGSRVSAPAPVPKHSPALSAFGAAKDELEAAYIERAILLDDMLQLSSPERLAPASSREVFARDAAATAPASTSGNIAASYDELTPLPAGWTIEWSNSRQREYYWHAASGKSIWSREDIPPAAR